MINIKRILFPTDFSEYSRHALKYAMALAERFKAKLYLLHVCEYSVTGAGMEDYHLAIPEVAAELERRERKALSTIVTGVRERGIDVEPIFLIGRAYQSIAKAATDFEIDIVALATHGNKGLTHLVFGSTAEKVVRLAPYPVLTVKSPSPEHDFVT
jgi:nucleotide-binding universal stress UspA family protein